MLHSVPYRRLLALAAVYVVVLQALLLPLAVAAGGALADGPCISSSADTHRPIANDSGCPCAAGCGAQCCVQGTAAAVPGYPVYNPAYAFLVRPAFVLEAASQAAARDPQIPRAPPSA